MSCIKYHFHHDSSEHSWYYCREHNRHTQTPILKECIISNVKYTFNYIQDFCLFFYLTYAIISCDIQLAPILMIDQLPFKVKIFINLEQNWSNGCQGERGNKTEVITRFRLTWFWFKKGRLSGKKNQQALFCLHSLPDFWKEKKERDGEWEWKKRDAEQIEIEAVNHTPCQWNKVNWHKETPLRNECTAERDSIGK